MAAVMESSSLISKTTVILEKSSDWMEWFFLRKDEATLNKVWEYCDPDAVEPPMLNEPIRPTPASVKDGAVLRSSLNAEERIDRKSTRLNSSHWE